MFKDSECWGDKPEDVEIAPTCVFVREGFEQIEQVDEQGDPTGIMGWSYRESKMSSSEFAAYANETAKMGMLDIEEAVAELYEFLIGD